MRAVHEQYFTPLPVASAMLELLNIQEGDRVIDPSCGEGIFLRLAADMGAAVCGIDIDPDMAAAAQELVGSAGDIFCHDGLYSDALSLDEESISVQEHSWDVVVGNPPFRSHGAIERRRAVLSRFALGCEDLPEQASLELDGLAVQGALFEMVAETKPMQAQAPEILFLERFINLAKPGGRIAIVLPDGFAVKAALQRARDHLIERCEVYAIIGLPREAFLDVGTEAKTVVIVARRRPAPPPLGGQVCLAEATDIGLRSDRNVLPEIVSGYNNGRTRVDPLILWKPLDEIRDRMTPEFYNPRYTRVIDELHDSGLRIRPLGELIIHTTYGQVGAREYADDGTVQLLSIRNHEPTGIDFWEERNFVHPSSHNDPQRSRLAEGDILLSNSGVRAIGRPTLVTHLPTAANITQHMQLIRLAEGVCAEALVIFLQSKFGQLQVEQRVTGVAASGLTYDDIKSIQVPDFREREAEIIRKRYLDMDSWHQRGQGAREQIARGNASPATQRRYERAMVRAEELRFALVADMETTIENGKFAF